MHLGMADKHFNHQSPLSMVWITPKAQLFKNYWLITLLKNKSRFFSLVLSSNKVHFRGEGDAILNNLVI